MDQLQARTVVLISSLIFDVFVGIAVALLAGAAIGGIVFVVGVGTSLLSMRMLGARRSAAGGPVDAPPADEPGRGAASAPDPAADPSYNPYARED